MREVDQANTQAKRDIILRAAIKCFSEVGLQKASIQDICRQAGMRSGHVYYYFKNKDEIIEASFNAGMAELLTKIELKLEHEDIAIAITNIHKWAENTRRGWNMTPGLRLEFVVEGLRNPRLRKKQVEWRDQIGDAVHKAAESAIASGRLDRRLDPVKFAKATRLLWSGISLLRVDAELDVEAYEDVIATLIQPWLREPAQAANPKVPSIAIPRN